MNTSSTKAPSPTAAVVDRERFGRVKAGTRREEPLNTEPPRVGGQTVDSLDEISITGWIASDTNETAPVDPDPDAFLLPVLKPGNWWEIPELPLGGLTTNPFPPWSIVNPDQTFVGATNHVASLHLATD